MLQELLLGLQVAERLQLEERRLSRHSRFRLFLMGGEAKYFIYWFELDKGAGGAAGLKRGRREMTVAFL